MVDPNQPSLFELTEPLAASQAREDIAAKIAAIAASGRGMAAAETAEQRCDEIAERREGVVDDSGSLAVEATEPLIPENVRAFIAAHRARLAAQKADNPMERLLDLQRQRYQ